MLDFSSFRNQHPDLCDHSKIRIPGLVSEEVPSGARVANWKEAYDKILKDDPWDEPPVVRQLMQEGGAEAFGCYVSFRLDPEHWGVYLRGKPLIGLAKEIHRVLNLGFIELKESVGQDVVRELAFSMAADVASNHVSFHASVDSFTAERELEAGVEYYGPYLQGPYETSLREAGEGTGANLEEVLANVTSLRTFLNPNMAVELGSLVNDSLNEEEQFRWNAYLMSGNLTTEIAYIMRAYPPSYRNFTEFLRRRGEVGPYAHMAIQYDLDTGAFNKALRELSGIVLKGEEREDAEKEMLKVVPMDKYLEID